jgi:hypothetical protein
MHKIYGNAQFTIIAAQGESADEGLYGVRSDSRPTFMGQTSRKINQNMSFLKDMALPADIRRSTWSTRGWCLQEQLLSGRLLVFWDNQVYWQCNRDMVFEDMPLELKSSQQPQPTSRQLYRMEPDQEPPKPKVLARVDRFHIAFPKSTSTAQALDNQERNTEVLGDGRTIVVRPPTFTQYTSIVALYSQRNLTKQADALNAVNGLLAMIALGLGTEMIYGLPENMLDAALLWKAQTCLTPRCNKDIPSWSWAGWQGEIEYESTVEFRPKDQNLPATSNNHLERLRPFVTWFKASRNGGPAQLLNGTGLGISNNALNGQLPREYAQSTQSFFSASSRQRSTSQSNPSDTSFTPQTNVRPTDWRQAETTLGFESTFMDDSHLESWDPMHLQFWTLCSSKFQNRFSRTEGSSATIIRNFTDKDETLVGELVLDEERGQWPLLGSTREHIPALIVLSEAQYFTDEKLNERYTVSKPEAEYHLYNVLLVDLDPSSGLALRKGIGKVTKSAWQEYDSEWKFIRLQ